MCWCSTVFETHSTSTSHCSLANWVLSVPSINLQSQFPTPSEDSTQATFLKRCSSASGVEKCMCVTLFVCVCICACVRRCTSEAPCVCFIIHTRVWILFQLAHTCQRYTLSMMAFSLYFLSNLQFTYDVNAKFNHFVFKAPSFKNQHKQTQTRNITL